MAIYNTGPYNAAAEHFGIDSDMPVATPRLKYNFQIEFILNENVVMEDASIKRNFIFHRVVSVGLPDLSYGIVPVNQYNRQRYVPTRMEVGTVPIVFYDTKDNIFQTLLKAYSGHYFHGHDLDTRNFNEYQTIQSEFGAGSTHPFGAKSVPQSSRFFFEEIRIHNRDSAQGGRSFALYNCMITNMTHDTLAHSDSQPIQYSVSFQPEHFNVGVISTGAGEEALAQSQAIGGTIPGTVSNRPAQLKQTVEAGVQVIETLGRAFDGAPGVDEMIQEINGVTRIVPKGLPADSSADVGPT